MLPILETERLRLRAFTADDIGEVTPLIGAREVAATTLRIPHPYSEEHFRHFLDHMQSESSPTLAITLRDGGQVIGGIGFRLEMDHQRAELGYWLGVPYWGHGYATEAAREMLRYGFEELKLHRIFAEYFEHNPASGRVLAKIGMQHEGCRREHTLKWERFVTAEQYEILRQE